MHGLFLALALTTGALTENVATRADAAQTYTLYLPSTYDAAKKHPVLLVFDPRGRGTAAAAIFRDAAETYGWIVLSANGTRSDDPSAPNDAAARALLNETGVYASDPKRIYAAGFSGTAILAWGMGIHTRRLAGVIGVGGRLEKSTPPARFNFAHYGFAGERDYNNREMRLIDDALEGVVPHRFSSFDGAHQWISPQLARHALGWFEALAGNRRAEVLAEDVAAAEQLTGLAAWRRWQAIDRTYGGFSDRIAQLDVSRELAEERKWDEFEAQYVSGVFERLGSLLAPIRKDPNAADLERVFRIKDLRRRAKRSGAEGAAARRLLEAVRGQTGSFLPRTFEELGEPAMAEALRKVAHSLAPPSQ